MDELTPHLLQKRASNCPHRVTSSHQFMPLIEEDTPSSTLHSIDESVAMGVRTYRSSIDESVAMGGRRMRESRQKPDEGSDRAIMPQRRNNSGFVQFKRPRRQPSSGEENEHLTLPSRSGVLGQWKSTSSSGSSPVHPSISTNSISTIEEVRTLCEQEFERASMVDRSEELPKFRYDEIMIGKFLGKGSFAAVYEVQGFDFNGGTNKTSSLGSSMRDALEGSSSSSSSGNNKENIGSDADVYDLEEEDEDFLDPMATWNREFLSRHCRRGEGGHGEARFAVKKLNLKKLAEDPQKVLEGKADLARETHFLGMIDHPNIVKLRALAWSSKYDDCYFLIIDRLYDTLGTRIQKWKQQRKKFTKSTSMWKNMFRKKAIRQQQQEQNTKRLARLNEDALMAQFELASALAFLHSKRIIYRDLKPANIGFDIRGDLKLFDLGLAKELHHDDAVLDQGKEGCLYHLTQGCGTPRYMASEVATGKPYNESCDVYAFALLCWQMTSLKLPYEKLDCSNLLKQVWSAPYQRPSIDKKWPVYLKNDILASGWNHNFRARPSMQQMESILEKEVAKYKKEFCLRNHLLKRRSSLVVKKIESMRRTAGPGAGKMYNVTEKPASAYRW